MPGQRSIIDTQGGTAMSENEKTRSSENAEVEMLSEVDRILSDFADDYAKLAE